jgi:hypothetical protein
MLSETAATILAAMIAGVFGLAGVWIGFYLSKRASEGDRRAEKRFAIYLELETLRNVLIAFQKHKIDSTQFFRKWSLSTEKLLGTLIGSDVDQKRILRTVNRKWEDPRVVPELLALADELLKKIDPNYARAAKELLEELGVKPEDIEPVILPPKS